MVGVLLAAVGAGTGAWVLETAGEVPRRLAPYVERRAEGHNSVIVGIGRVLSTWWIAADRGLAVDVDLARLRHGAHFDAPPAAPSRAAGRTMPVASADALRKAMVEATAGDVIEVLPGTYRVTEQPLRTVAGGAPGRPILVRGAPGGVSVVEFDAVEGIRVSQPHWRFENLVLRGVCGRHDDCEHAFHVVAGATDFVSRNNRLEDFNAHFKVNAEGERFPDRGLIDQTTMTNGSVRDTLKPVTPVDIVAASHWTLRDSVITDFVRAHGDRVSHGAFSKGAGEGAIFERNVVLCEHRLRGHPGMRVGLSLGGGGAGPAVCRDKRCVVEHAQGVIRDNLIAFCSDEGIYLNKAAQSIISGNTLIDTAGIDVRFPESTADVVGNLVDGRLRARAGAILRSRDNVTTPVAALYVGYHPVRSFFRDPGSLDLAWRSMPGRASFPARPDACGATRPASALPGAFEAFAPCLRGSVRPA